MSGKGTLLSLAAAKVHFKFWPRFYRQLIDNWESLTKPQFNYRYKVKYLLTFSLKTDVICQMIIFMGMQMNNFEQIVPGCKVELEKIIFF